MIEERLKSMSNVCTDRLSVSIIHHSSYTQMKTFTESELLLYNGEDPSLPIYLAIDETVYDVSANPRMYGKVSLLHSFNIIMITSKKSEASRRNFDHTFVPLKLYRALLIITSRVEMAQELL